MTAITEFSLRDRGTKSSRSLTQLKQLIEKGDLKPWEFNGMKAIWFGRHLYEPLIYPGPEHCRN